MNDSDLQIKIQQKVMVEVIFEVYIVRPQDKMHSYKHNITIKSW